MTTETPTTQATPRPAEIQAVPVRHPGRWVAAAVVLILVAMLVHTIVANPNWQWGVVGDYVFDSTIEKAVLRTLELTVIAMAIGIVGGIVLAVMRLSRNPIVSGASWVYIWFFRGTPVLVQIIFWYSITAIFQSISLGVPFGPAFVSGNANSVITRFTAAILGLGLNEAAYMAEIVRAGILSVDEGQTEAAQALGMSSLQTMRRIVLPQAMRIIVPPTGNETISMLKTTSLVSAISYLELLGTAQIIYGRNYRTVQLLLVASLWYLFMTSLLTIGQYYVERYFARGSARALPETPLQKLRRNLFGAPRHDEAPTLAAAPGGQPPVDLSEEHR